MASRNDVDVEFTSSPRVAEVASPSTEIIMQDLVDTMRDAEYSWTGMTAKKLINASGKEDLGGGVKVGITVALQDLKLAFEGRTVPAQVGTVSTNPGSAVQGRDAFTDSSATFITNGVTRGSLVVNFTDQSVAEVVSVDSETQLTTKTLTEGIGNTYDVNDTYKVWNIVQVSATGGNLVGVDPSQVTVPAILPTAFTQVVVTSSASATLSEQLDIQFSSFNNHVIVDTGNITGKAATGTTFPAGTGRQPCLNFADALDIAAANGLDRLLIKGNATLPTGLSFANTHFEGESKTSTLITIPGAADVTGCEYFNCTITGALDGASAAKECVLNTVSGLDGEFTDCGIKGTLAIAPGGEGEFINCYSEVAGTATPILVIGDGVCFGRDYSGGIEFQGKTSTAGFSWDFDSGQAVVNDNNTTGSMTLRGVAKWTNALTYTGTATVNNELLTGGDLQSLRKLMQNRMETNPTTGVMTIYDDDDTTVFMTGNIYEDVLAAQIYRGRGIERRNRLS